MSRPTPERLEKIRAYCAPWNDEKRDLLAEIDALRAELDNPCADECVAETNRIKYLKAENDRLREELKLRRGVHHITGEIDILSDNLEHMRKERDFYRTECDRLHEKYDFQLIVKERDALRAIVKRLQEAYLPGNWEKLDKIIKDRDRLREALEKIYNCPTDVEIAHNALLAQAAHDALWPDPKYISPEDAKFLRDAQKSQAASNGSENG